MKALTAQALRARLDYDPLTVVFVRRARKGARRGVAGCQSPDGYIRVQVGARRYMAHRLAWLYVYGCWPSEGIDHINGVRSDNRIANLRDVSQSVNNQNYRRPRRDNSTGYLGVSINGRGFQASIRIDRRKRCLGTFPTPAEAHEAYLAAKRQLHPGGML